MILTGKAAEYAEKFEKFDKEILASHPDAIEELTEDEQIDLFNIIMMFERDRNFQHFMRGCLALYSTSVVEGNKGINKLMTKMQEVAKCLSRS